MEIKIVNNFIMINDAPLEEIQIDNSKLIVLFDDFNEDRWIFKTTNIAFRLIALDYTKPSVYVIDRLNLSHGRFYKYILEITDSPWIKELERKSSNEPIGCFKNFHHYVLFLGDNLCEILSSDIGILKQMKP
ncbi:hypothetical protein [Candidatus Enterococcus clewellii]|uniref:Uncharacterized protein n=1 Tax=Candidatus Enterococcus clewellii TaxID=1834193 RepID=A0AAQ3W175_9ENTE